MISIQWFHVLLIMIQQEAQQLIDRAIAKYSADTIGKFDFALESAGGSVLLNKCSKSYSSSLATVSILSIPLWHVASTPKVIIQVCALSLLCLHYSLVFPLS